MCQRDVGRLPAILIAVNPPIEASASSDEQVSIETDDLPSISLSPTALATELLEGSISVYLALVTPERVPVDYAISTSIFIGIKPLVESVGRRDGQAKWIWSEFQEITFHREVEYWGTHGFCSTPVAARR